ncbi:MAG TPA: hypothetical protein DF699_14810, partial [Phycisphaerales bacterium]|nr:hypothetical protein [Phycisphaerales bacterium]
MVRRARVFARRLRTGINPMHRQSSCGRARAFTLIELLVVIAIIALL